MLDYWKKIYYDEQKIMDKSPKEKWIFARNLSIIMLKYSKKSLKILHSCGKIQNTHNIYINSTNNHNRYPQV